MKFTLQCAVLATLALACHASYAYSERWPDNEKLKGRMETIMKALNIRKRSMRTLFGPLLAAAREVRDLNNDLCDDKIPFKKYTRTEINATFRKFNKVYDLDSSTLKKWGDEYDAAHPETKTNVAEFVADTESTMDRSAMRIRTRSEYTKPVTESANDSCSEIRTRRISTLARGPHRIEPSHATYKSFTGKRRNKTPSTVFVEHNDRQRARRESTRRKKSDEPQVAPKVEVILLKSEGEGNWQVKFPNIRGLPWLVHENELQPLKPKEKWTPQKGDHALCKQ